MSLVREQSLFLLQAAELIRKANELGFTVSGGELFRTPEQQSLHVQNGRSVTMASPVRRFRRPLRIRLRFPEVRRGRQAGEPAS